VTVDLSAVRPSDVELRVLMLTAAATAEAGCRARPGQRASNRLVSALAATAGVIATYDALILLGVGS